MGVRPTSPGVTLLVLLIVVGISSGTQQSDTDAFDDAFDALIESLDIDSVLVPDRVPPHEATASNSGSLPDGSSLDSTSTKSMHGEATNSAGGTMSFPVKGKAASVSEDLHTAHVLVDAWTEVSLDVSLDAFAAAHRGADTGRQQQGQVCLFLADSADGTACQEIDLLETDELDHHHRCVPVYHGCMLKHAPFVPSRKETTASVGQGDQVHGTSSSSTEQAHSGATSTGNAAPSSLGTEEWTFRMKLFPHSAGRLWFPVAVHRGVVLNADLVASGVNQRSDSSRDVPQGSSKATGGVFLQSRGADLGSGRKLAIRAWLHHLPAAHEAEHIRPKLRSVPRSFFSSFVRDSSSLIKSIEHDAVEFFSRVGFGSNAAQGQGQGHGGSRNKPSASVSLWTSSRLSSLAIRTFAFIRTAWAVVSAVAATPVWCLRLLGDNILAFLEVIGFLAPADDHRHKRVGLRTLHSRPGDKPDDGSPLHGDGDGENEQSSAVTQFRGTVGPGRSYVLRYDVEVESVVKKRALQWAVRSNPSVDATMKNERTTTQEPAHEERHDSDSAVYDDDPSVTGIPPRSSEEPPGKVKDSQEKAEGADNAAAQNSVQEFKALYLMQRLCRAPEHFQLVLEPMTTVTKTGHLQDDDDAAQLDKFEEMEVGREVFYTAPDWVQRREKQRAVKAEMKRQQALGAHHGHHHDPDHTSRNHPHGHHDDNDKIRRSDHKSSETKERSRRRHSTDEVSGNRRRRHAVSAKNQGSGHHDGDAENEGQSSADNAHNDHIDEPDHAAAEAPKERSRRHAPHVKKVKALSDVELYVYSSMPLDSSTPGDVGGVSSAEASAEGKANGGAEGEAGARSPRPLYASSSRPGAHAYVNDSVSAFDFGQWRTHDRAHHSYRLRHGIDAAADADDVLADAEDDDDRRRRGEALLTRRAQEWATVGRSEDAGFAVTPGDVHARQLRFPSPCRLSGASKALVDGKGGGGSQDPDHTTMDGSVDSIREPWSLNTALSETETSTSTLQFYAVVFCRSTSTPCRFQLTAHSTWQTVQARYTEIRSGTVDSDAAPDGRTGSDGSRTGAGSGGGGGGKGSEHGPSFLEVIEALFELLVLVLEVVA